jgi:chromosome segregation ATPase
MDLNMLKSSEEIDSKYKELQSKLDLDIKELTNKEREFELKLKDLSKRESNIENVENDIKNRLDELVDKERQFNDFKNEILRLDEEIKNWEAMHWKFRRNIAPPSAILETRNPNTEY